MCYALFIGSDEQLPVEDAVEADDRFHLEELQPEHEQMRVIFSKPYVYYAAAWGGCGCGWFTSWSPFSIFPSRRKASHATADCVSQLGLVISDLLVRFASVELFLGWEGELDEGVVRRLSLSTRDFERTELPLQQGDFAVIQRSPS